MASMHFVHGNMHQRHLCLTQGCVVKNCMRRCLIASVTCTLVAQMVIRSQCCNCLKVVGRKTAGLPEMGSPQQWEAENNSKWESGDGGSQKWQVHKRVLAASQRTSLAGLQTLWAVAESQQQHMKPQQWQQQQQQWQLQIKHGFCT